MRYEILDRAGVVVNTIMADQDFVEAMHPGRYRLVQSPVEPEPVPQVVSRFQARAAMLMTPATSDEYPNLLEQINAAVAATGDPFAQLAWSEAVEWRRDSPIVNTLGGAVGVSQEQLDALFRAAAGIVA